MKKEGNEIGHGFLIGQTAEIKVDGSEIKKGAKKTELCIDELDIKQKLGMTMIGHIYRMADKEKERANIDYALELIRKRSLGAIWVEPTMPKLSDIMREIDEAADYPIIVVTDAESGIGENIIGRHNSIGTTGSEELAYTFGKVTGIGARKLGYNMICAPLLDMCLGNHPCGATVRSLGSDKYEVARLGAKIAEGLHDAGVLTVAKHYPGASHPKKKGVKEMDSHMAQTTYSLTKEELLDFSLYPYSVLMEKGLLDAIMVGHACFENIDPEHPATLSKEVIGIIREMGFDGISLTDALEMMGIVAKFGSKTSKGLAIAAGNDLALTWVENEFSYNAIVETYEKGLIPDERINEAVRRVLTAHHKINLYAEPKYADFSKEDLERFERINLDSIYEKRDEGVSAALSRDGNHLFVVLCMNEMGIDASYRITNDTMGYYWYRPAEIVKKLESLFPNSRVMVVPQFSTGAQNWDIVRSARDYDDFVFVTFNEVEPNIGKERLTTRTVSVIEALQVSNKVAAVVHFGNPYVLEELPHVPRVLVAGTAPKSAMYAMEVLAGIHEAKGVLTYNAKLN